MKINENNQFSSRPNKKEFSEIQKPDNLGKNEEPQESFEASNSTQYSSKEGNYTEALENGDKILKCMARMMTGAKKSIQVQMYRLGHQKAIDLLVEQAKRGIQVQVLLDPTPGYDSEDIKNQTEMQNYLKANGVQILKYPINQSGKIDHVKMLIVDGKSLLIGGMNWDKHSPQNQDSDVFIRGPVVGDAENVFQQDWKLAGGKNITLPAPPPQKDANSSVTMLTTDIGVNDIYKTVQKNIKNAKKSIKMEAFVLTDKETINNLIEAHNRGVDVKVILEPNKPMFFPNNKTAQKLKEAGIQVRWLDVDVDKREKLHEKLAVFDDDKTIIGSCNFSQNGFFVNHEADVEVVSKAVGSAFTNMFEEHWENRSLEKSPNIPDFNEKMPGCTREESIGINIFKFFDKNFHPEEHHIWAGERKDIVMKAADNYDGASIDVPNFSENNNDKSSMVKEMETIGKLASFISNLENLQISPAPGENKTLYESRLENAQKRSFEAAKNTQRYLQEMSDCIENPETRLFVSKVLENAPEGFLKNSSSLTGHNNPADEIDPSIIDLSKNSSYPEYEGGGLVLHSRRVQALAESLCDKFGVIGDEKSNILAAAALYNVIKCVTPEDIQTSPAQKNKVDLEADSSIMQGNIAAQWLHNMDESDSKEESKNITPLIAKHSKIFAESTPTPPKNLPEFVVALADYMASQKNFYIEI